MSRPPSLLDLARALDQTDPADIEARVNVAVQFESALGDKYSEFDDRFDKLVGLDPEHPKAAETVLYQMGLAGPVAQT